MVQWTGRGRRTFDCSQQQGIKPDIVFGTNVKIQAVDPYLFIFTNLVRLTAQIIVIIGYSFNDTHK